MKVHPSPGADPALNMTGAQTGNGQETAGKVFGTSGGCLGALSTPGKPKGVRCSEMHSQPFLALKIINIDDLLFKKLHFISSISYVLNHPLPTPDLCNGFHHKRLIYG